MSSLVRRHHYYYITICHCGLSAILLVFAERFPTSGNDMYVTLRIAVLVGESQFFLKFFDALFFRELFS